MGYGGYSNEAHETFTRARATAPVAEVFRERTGEKMSPRGVKLRESRDSALHPNSLAIVFALDVTGSMCEIPAQLAQHHLPSFMRQIGDFGVSDAQLMFCGVGDFECDRAPLQVGQFESEAQLMDQWLTGIFLEHGGGGNGHESYETAIGWIATHTSIDCAEKRGKKGYLFLTGDDNPAPSVSIDERVFGDGWTARERMSAETAIRLASEKYHVFFLVPDRRRAEAIERSWRPLLGDHFIELSRPAAIVDAAAAIVALTEGTRDLAGIASGLADEKRPADQIRETITALTPYAATLGRDGVPAPRMF